MMVAPDQVYTAEVSAILYKSTSLTVSLEGEYADYYGIKKANQTSYAKTLTFDASDGLGAESTPTVTITIAYTSTDLENALDKTVTVKLETDNPLEGRTVSVAMKEAPKFTFLPSGIEGCTYKVEYADNNVSATNVSATGEAIEKSITSEGMKTLTFTATATDASNYKFFGWQTIDDNEVGTYFSYENPCKEKDLRREEAGACREVRKSSGGEMWKDIILNLARSRGYESQQDLAHALGWSRQQLNAKLCNPSSWVPSQVRALSDLLELTDSEWMQLVSALYR
jgi:hypothetical protein